MTNQEIIGKIKEALSPFIAGARYILYGSRARGDFHPRSDVDLMILLPDNYKGKKFADTQYEITRRLYDLELQWNMEIEISPLILTHQTFSQRVTPFTRNVLKDAIYL